MILACHIDYPHYVFGSNATVWSTHFGKITLKKPTLNKKRGYLYVSLEENGVRRNAILHRMVAEIFISNPERKKYVNHKNGIKTDNGVSNLEWVTAKENARHALVNGLIDMGISRGELSTNSKLKQSDVIEIRRMAKKMYHKEIAERFGIGVSTVTHIVNGTRWGWLAVGL